MNKEVELVDNQTRGNSYSENFRSSSIRFQPSSNFFFGLLIEGSNINNSSILGKATLGKPLVNKIT